MQLYGVRTLLMCFVLASFTLPLMLERRSAAQQAERGQGTKTVNAANAERRVALVIGNGNYSVRPLTNPPNDARALAAALKDLGFEVISGENLTLAEMRQKLRAFGNSLRGSAVGLFFFAGHGVQVNGINYLIPIGANIETEPDVELEAVSANNVLSQMDAANNPVNLLILDACRDNPFRSFRRSGARGLAQVRALSGTLIAYATAPDDTAADGKGSNSPYTTEILRHIRTPGLKIEDFFKRVRLGVEAQTNRQQTPWESSSLRGDFYFVPPKDDRPGGEYAFWKAIEDSADPQDFREFLDKYPSGEYANAARVRLRRLTANSTLPTASLPSSDVLLNGGLRIEMVNLPGGTFTMGSNDGDNAMKPPHQVTVSAFAIGKYEVTQAQWQKVMGNNPSNHKGDNLPVENVSWENAQEFCRKLGNAYRLPTEAEWEYAARAGSTTKWSFGNDESKLGEYAWFSSNSGIQTHPVGKKKANGFGLFDMHGNVWEWCEDDWYDNYNGAPKEGHAWKSADISGRGSYHVYRGGASDNLATGCQSAFRYCYPPSYGSDSLGFRLARTLR